MELTKDELDLQIKVYGYKYFDEQAFLQYSNYRQLRKWLNHKVKAKELEYDGKSKMFRVIKKKGKRVGLAPKDMSPIAGGVKCQLM